MAGRISTAPSTSGTSAMVVWFFSKTPNYSWLSNFSEHPFVIGQVKWPSVEHFYQAQKHVDLPQVIETIRGMASPSQARTAGRDSSLTVRPDWDAVKEEVMRQAVRAKFTQHVALQKLLLATGDNELVHESDDDLFWGRQRRGSGQNRLGLILMQLRTELRGHLVEQARELPELVLFHLPHDATLIPADVVPQFALSADELRLEIIRMTDHSTLHLYGHGVAEQQIVSAPVSRLVVDVERFDNDDFEPMAARGMGVVYERTSDGRQLRHPLSPDARKALIDGWYRPHHERLVARTSEALSKCGYALLVDAHSFASRALPYEPDQRPDRPQICIGTDDGFHTPPKLAACFVQSFRSAGFDVRVNAPYSGVLVPMRYYRKNPRVRAVMVEINRSLYLVESTGERCDQYASVALSIRQCIDQAISNWAESTPSAMDWAS